jgi:hypothetical protein
MTTVDGSTARALKREHEALRGKTTPTKSLKHQMLATSPAQSLFFLMNYVICKDNRVLFSAFDKWRFDCFVDRLRCLMGLIFEAV